jgi:cell wall-associated NlpC family hydrolase
MGADKTVTATFGLKPPVHTSPAITGFPSSSGSSQGSAIVAAAEAMQSQGYPYCFDGGNTQGPTVGISDPESDGSYSNCASIGRVGFDCTGLTLYAVYQGTGNAGLSHDGYQAHSGGGQVIGSQSALQPGDIVYFDHNASHGLGYIDHAGVYVGNGEVLSAISERYGIGTHSIPWYEAGGLHFVGAVRYWGSSPGPTNTGYETAFQANTGDLWSVGPDDMHGGWGFGIAPETSPAITSVGNSYEMAFQANTGNLWSVGPYEMHGSWGFGMAAGTNPAITSVGNSYEMAFQSNTGNLWSVGPYEMHGGWEFGMAAGTSPAITALPGGGYEMAFQANTGELWTVGSDMHGSWGFGMMPGTSPAIAALPSGGYEVAFQANTGNLWSVGPYEMHGSWGFGMAAGTNPAITSVGNSYEMAFQSNTGNLWSVGPYEMHGGWEFGMAAGTSPAISAAGNSYEMAFQSNTGDLWSVGPDEMHGGWAFGMK